MKTTQTNFSQSCIFHPIAKNLDPKIGAKMQQILLDFYYYHWSYTSMDLFNAFRFP